MRDRLLRLGLGRMRREARKRTCRSENFFSSSRVRLDSKKRSISSGFQVATKDTKGE